MLAITNYLHKWFVPESNRLIQIKGVTAFKAYVSIDRKNDDPGFQIKFLEKYTNSTFTLYNIFSITIGLRSAYSFL